MLNGLKRRLARLAARLTSGCPTCGGQAPRRGVLVCGDALPPEPITCPTCAQPIGLVRQYAGVAIERV